MCRAAGICLRGGGGGGGGCQDLSVYVGNGRYIYVPTPSSERMLTTSSLLLNYQTHPGIITLFCSSAYNVDLPQVYVAPSSPLDSNHSGRSRVEVGPGSQHRTNVALFLLI